VSAALLAVLALLAPGRQSPGPGTQVLIVTGLSGEPRYAAAFAKDAASIFDAARTRWGVADSSLIYLAERADADPARVRGKATRAEVLAALARLHARAHSGDVILLVIFGHGSQQGDEPRVSLPGPDLTASDLAAALAPFQDQTVVVVNTASASGGFLGPLSGPHRVVLTATRTGFERNATQFGGFFAEGLGGGAADLDKDGRVSIAEAFEYARDRVAKSFESEKRLLTEHAQLDDNGDHAGSAALGDTAKDGALARAVTFAVTRQPANADPRAAGLLAERRRLETAVAELRQRKATLDSTAYERELEKLLLSLAETNQALRALEKKAP
jgi:hypothetical protein